MWIKFPNSLNTVDLLEFAGFFEICGEKDREKIMGELIETGDAEDCMEKARWEQKYALEFYVRNDEGATYVSCLLYPTHPLLTDTERGCIINAWAAAIRQGLQAREEMLWLDPEESIVPGLKYRVELPRDYLGELMDLLEVAPDICERLEGAGFVELPGILAGLGGIDDGETKQCTKEGAV